jgi:hypothetical protein
VHIHYHEKWKNYNHQSMHTWLDTLWHLPLFSLDCLCFCHCMQHVSRNIRLEYHDIVDYIYAFNGKTIRVLLHSLKLVKRGYQ